MSKDRHLSSPVNQERPYKCTILTPHTFLPPDHSDSLEDDLAEEFAGYLRNRVSIILGAKSYTPHRSGEAFLNMRFDEFEEKFLRYSEYAVFITSGKNAASLDLIYPRMLVFLTIRPTWRSRGIVVYLGPPEGQKVFDPNLFLTKPLIFPMNPEDWESPESPWDILLGGLLPQIPRTPELVRSKHLVEHLPTKIATASTNEKAAASTSQPGSQSPAQTAVPNKSRHAKKSELTAQESIRFSGGSESARFFALSPPSSSFETHRTIFRHSESRHSIQRSFSLDDMCFCTGRSHRKSTHKKSQQKRNSEPVLSTKSKKDLLCIFPPLISGKKKRKGDATLTPVVVETPEVIRVATLKDDTLKSLRKPLESHCLQVQIGDEIPNSRSTPHSTTSASPPKRRTYTLSSGRRTRTQCDSGIVSNYSLVSAELSTSDPNLYPSQQQQIMMTSPQSFFSSSSPSYLDGTFSQWIRHKKQKESPGVFSMRTDSSVEEQRGTELGESLKFADDGNDADVTILSDKSGMCEAEPFRKPGIPPLVNQPPFKEVNAEMRSDSLVLNPDSRASTDSVDDPTQCEDYDNELPYDSKLQREQSSSQKERDDFENKPHAVQLEQRILSDSKNESPDSLSWKVSTANGETTTSKSDLFINELPSAQIPTGPLDSGGSFDRQMISGEHPLTVSDCLQQENTSPAELKILQSYESNWNQGIEDARCAQTSFSEKERNVSLLSPNEVTNTDSGIPEKSCMPEEPIEPSVNASVQAVPHQIAGFKTEEALSSRELVQNEQSESSESDESTIREAQEGSEISSWSKCDPTNQRIKATTKSEDEQSLTAESLRGDTSKTSMLIEASSDSGLLSLGSPDTISLSAATDLSSLNKEELVPSTEESDTINHSSHKLPAVIEKTFGIERQYNITPVQEEAVFASEMTGDHSMTPGESHLGLFPANSTNELSSTEKSLDSGIQSASDTLQKGIKSTSVSITPDTDQDLKGSEKVPTRLKESLNQEAAEIESYVQESQDVIMPLIVAVQARPVSAAIEETPSEDMLTCRNPSEPAGMVEVTDAAVHPTVKKHQESKERVQESVQKLQRESEIPSIQGSIETNVDQRPEPLIIQREGTLNSSSPPVMRSDDGNNLEEKLAGLEQESVDDLLPTAERRSIFVDNTDAVTIFDQGAYEIARDMLKICSPETLRLVRSAAKTYNKDPKFTESSELDQQNFPSTVPVISSTGDAQPSSPVAHQPTFLRKVIPQISVALINLSTAYIPRYISTIYDYSMALVRPEHPDRNLRELTTTVQEAILNHPLGVPIILAGTTLISPWVLRQFPLTIMAICQGAPEVLSQLLENPGNFLTEHFADITEVFHASPTWSAFAIVGSRGIHWRLLRPIS
ncbi:hypothetical protein Aperf_G00000076413 [Anoplocephala perfoliata]